MRTRRPFPDVEERDPEELGVVVVDPTNFSEFFPEHEADTAVSANGFTPSTADNRKARRAGVANWAPPVQEPERLLVKDISPERMATMQYGMVVNDSDGRPWRVSMLDRSEGRAEYELVLPPMPTRRDLLQQRKRRDRGTMDVALRRLQRSAIGKVKR
jgi:hypothetical protein